ncbi:MAG: cytidylate kinase [Cellvibrionaceae bacterium]|jgi:cytidylate kinase
MNTSNSAPVITVDGPSGSGKGTVCREIAERLGFHLLDSGALYRLVAVAAHQRDLETEDEVAIVQLTKHLNIRFEPGEKSVGVYLDDREVTGLIRQEIFSVGASKVAALPEVRKALLARQRDFQKPPGLVADGRDMGTTVFPEATLKIFLTAEAEERAKRRYQQLIEQGESANLRHLLKDIKVRDARDTKRSVSPLKPADDAILIDSTQLSIEEVVEKILLLHAREQSTKHGT